MILEIAEFVLNADRPEEFFFLEVNTRLQVSNY